MENDKYAGSDVKNNHQIAEVSTLYRCDSTQQEDALIAQALQVLENRARNTSTCFLNPKQSGKYFRLRLGDSPIEIFSVAFLNTKNQLIVIGDVSKGTIDNAPVFPREVVKKALRHNAKAVVFAHNHPSGSLEASQSDIHITQKLTDALALFSIKVLDHLIVNCKNYYSMVEGGKINPPKTN